MLKDQKKELRSRSGCWIGVFSDVRCPLFLTDKRHRQLKDGHPACPMLKDIKRQHALEIAEDTIQNMGTHGSITGKTMTRILYVSII